MSPMTDPNYISMEGFIALLIIGIIANIIVRRHNK